jgi:hypothetical protein
MLVDFWGRRSSEMGRRCERGMGMVIISPWTAGMCFQRRFGWHVAIRFGCVVRLPSSEFSPIGRTAAPRMPSGSPEGKAWENNRLRR